MFHDGAGHGVLVRLPVGNALPAGTKPKLELSDVNSTVLPTLSTIALQPLLPEVEYGEQEPFH